MNETERLRIVRVARDGRVAALQAQLLALLVVSNSADRLPASPGILGEAHDPIGIRGFGRPHV